jgi:hypothetical protein
VITEVDMALMNLLKTEVFANSKVTITFDAPNKANIAQFQTPCVNLYLHDFRENVSARESMTEPIRDVHGRIVGRRMPPRFFDLHYVITAWSTKVTIEHKLLDSMLRCFIRNDLLPREYLSGELAEQPRIIQLTVAQGVKRGMLLSMAGDLKPSIELSVSVPFPGGDDQPVGPPIQAKPTVSVADRATGQPGAPVATPEQKAAAAAGQPMPRAPQPGQPPQPVPPKPTGPPPLRPAGAAPGQPRQAPARPAGAAPAQPGQAPARPAGAAPAQPGQPPARPAGAAPAQPGQAPARPAGAPPAAQPGQPPARPAGAAPAQPGQAPARPAGAPPAAVTPGPAGTAAPQQKPPAPPASGGGAPAAPAKPAGTAPAKPPAEKPKPPPEAPADEQPESPAE